MAKGVAYYYFRVRRPNITDIVPYGIKESAVYIDDNIMLNFKQMTEEQKAFYLEHPTATVMEVWNCEITPPYVPPTPDVSEYAEQKVKELKDACYGSVSVTSLEFAMAIDKIENPASTACYYNLTKAIQVRDDFRSQSKHAMQVLDTYKLRIEAAQNAEAVDAIYEEAISKL